MARVARESGPSEALSAALDRAWTAHAALTSDDPKRIVMATWLDECVAAQVAGREAETPGRRGPKLPCRKHEFVAILETRAEAWAAMEAVLAALKLPPVSTSERSSQYRRRKQRHEVSYGDDGLWDAANFQAARLRSVLHCLAVLICAGGWRGSEDQSTENTRETDRDTAYRTVSAVQVVL